MRSVGSVARMGLYDEVVVVELLKGIKTQC